MEENEIILESAEEKTEPAAQELDAQENAECAEEPAEETGEEAPEEAGEAEEDGGEEISADAFAKTLANPMFALFARGRSGSIEEAVRDFEKMISAGRSTLTEDELMKMTPGAVGFAGGNALTERQRRIAREAGMSYREYYEVIRTIPTKTK
jgi:hypothetical protein